MAKLQWVSGLMAALIMIAYASASAFAQTNAPTGPSTSASPNGSLPEQNSNPMLAPGAPMNPLPTNPTGLPSNNGTFGPLSNPAITNPTMPGTSTTPGSTLQPSGGSTAYPR